MLILTLFMLNAKKIRYIRNRKFLPVGFSSSLKAKNNYHISIFGFVWSVLKNYRIAIILITLCGIIDTLVDFSFGPLFTKIIVKSVDNYVGPRGEIMSVLLQPLCLIIFIWFTSDVLIRCASWYYNTRLDPAIDAKIKMTFLNRVSKNSYEFFTTNETGETISCLSILWNIKCITKNIFRQIIPRFTACVILLSTLVAIHWQLGAIMIGYTIIYVLLLVFSLHKISSLKGKQMKAYARTISNITDMLMNFSSVIFFSRKKFEFDRIKQIQTFESNRIQKSAVFLEKLKILRSLICFTICCLFYIGTTFYLYKLGKIDLSDMLYAMSASFESIALIGLVQEDILDIIGDMSFVRKALNVMNSGKIADEHIQGGSELNIKDSSIEIKNLSFGYNNNDELFNNLNISIKSGEKIGLAGRSGSGKTTLINLILKNLIPQEGSIEIGGKDISFISESSLKDKISIVSQDTILFNRSILDNIRYSKPNASMEEVIEIAKKANAHDFIKELEYGYDTNVGERGMRLSGGQRQRILIARAMLKNTPILILDEATSALDSETEQKVSESFNRLMDGKTVIAIAHRLQTLKKMDRIIVFRDGEIVEQGTHEELLDNSNVYKSLWKIQTEGMILDD